MRLLPVVALMFATVACSGDDSDRPAAGPTVGLVPIADAGVSSTTVVAPPGVDPSSMHLDDLGMPRRPAQPNMPARDRRPIDVTLRSTPPGAQVAVDGNPIGVTPAHWPGYADGREHEFVFTLPRHAIARYRFVPISSGVIHAQLDRVGEQRDAGVAPPPEVVPSPPPSAIIPPAPPPTVVSPPQQPRPAPSVTPPATHLQPSPPTVDLAPAPDPSPGIGPQP